MLYLLLKSLDQIASYLQGMTPFVTLDSDAKHCITRACRWS